MGPSAHLAMRGGKFPRVKYESYHSGWERRVVREKGSSLHFAFHWPVNGRGPRVSFTGGSFGKVWSLDSVQCPGFKLSSGLHHEQQSSRLLFLSVLLPTWLWSQVGTFWCCWAAGLWEILHNGRHVLSKVVRLQILILSRATQDFDLYAEIHFLNGKNSK